MAEALFNHIAAERGLTSRAESAGTAHGGRLNPVAVQVMREIGIDMSEQKPKLISQELVIGADRVVSMGCGVDSDSCPVKFLAAEDWNLEDPAGQSITKVREIRDQIRERVVMLLNEAEASKRA